MVVRDRYRRRSSESYGSFCIRDIQEIRNALLRDKAFQLDFANGEGEILKVVVEIAVRHYNIRTLSVRKMLLQNTSGFTKRDAGEAAGLNAERVPTSLTTAETPFRAEGLEGDRFIAGENKDIFTAAISIETVGLRCSEPDRMRAFEQRKAKCRDHMPGVGSLYYSDRSHGVDTGSTG